MQSGRSGLKLTFIIVSLFHLLSISKLTKHSSISTARVDIRAGRFGRRLAPGGGGGGKGGRGGILFLVGHAVIRCDRRNNALVLAGPTMGSKLTMSHDDVTYY